MKKNNNLKGKDILITGGSGMIARQLINLLLKEKALINIADLKKPNNLSPQINFHKVDLKNYHECLRITKSIDYVFNLVGIKCSPKMCFENPANIIGPMLQFNTNMLEAAMFNNVEWYLYTSSIGVYDPSEVMSEESVWNTYPSKNDWYGGWAKRIGELQCQAYEIQNGEGKCSIVRPANTYGPYDNFDLQSAMVIPSLIRKASDNKEVEVWGDGSEIRDFIYSKDVARGMIHALKNKITEPINLGSGLGYSISAIAEIIANHYGKNIKWINSDTKGDRKRLLNMKKAKENGFKISVSIHDGIINTINWYEKNKKIILDEYFAFK